MAVFCACRLFVVILVDIFLFILHYTSISLFFVYLDSYFDDLFIHRWPFEEKRRRLSLGRIPACICIAAMTFPMDCYAHISHAERERERCAVLRGRQLWFGWVSVALYGDAVSELVLEIRRQPISNIDVYRKISAYLDYQVAKRLNIFR